MNADEFQAKYKNDGAMEKAVTDNLDIVEAVITERIVACVIEADHRAALDADWPTELPEEVKDFIVDVLSSREVVAEWIDE